MFKTLNFGVIDNIAMVNLYSVTAVFLKMQVSWKHLYSLPSPMGNCSLEMALLHNFVLGSGFLKSSQSSCSWGCGHWKAWLGPGVYLHRDSLTWGRRPQFLSTWASPQASWVSLLHGGWPPPEWMIKRPRQKLQHLPGPLLEVTHGHFHPTLLVTKSVLFSIKKGTSPGHDYQEVRLTEGNLGTGYHIWKNYSS